MMTHRTHTPDPWVIRMNTIFNTTTNPAVKIATIHSKRDAKVLVAAPDLLAVAEMMDDLLSLVEGNNSPEIIKAHAVKYGQAARAVIAKAKGEHHATHTPNHSRNN